MQRDAGRCDAPISWPRSSPVRGATERAVHLEVLIFRLRRKVQKAWRCDLPLQSVRGFGYVFLPDTRIDMRPSERDGAARG